VFGVCVVGGLGFWGRQRHRLTFPSSREQSTSSELTVCVVCVLLPLTSLRQQIIIFLIFLILIFLVTRE
jgi:hypothetical protein